MRQIVCFLWHCARQLHQAQRLFLWFSNFALTFVCNHFRAHTYTMLWPISCAHLCAFVRVCVRLCAFVCVCARLCSRICVLRPNSCEGMMAPTTESNCFATFYHPRVSTTHPLVKVENCEISVAAIGIFPTGEGFKIKEKRSNKGRPQLKKTFSFGHSPNKRGGSTHACIFWPSFKKCSFGQ